MNARSITLDGEVLGTPEYMAPEQALGRRDVGPGADRYALAAIAMELLTGHLPYSSAPPLQLLRMIIESPPRRPSELGLAVEGLDAVFDRAMSRDPRARFPSSRSFVRAMPACVASTPPPTFRRRSSACGFLA
jgi:eukaryotic-like serine/threonine-protein kinase